jgi:hypothetical protein
MERLEAHVDQGRREVADACADAVVGVISTATTERDEILSEGAGVLRAAIGMYEALMLAGQIPRWYQAKGEYWFERYAAPALARWVEANGWRKTEDGLWEAGMGPDLTARLRARLYELHPELAPAARDKTQAPGVE